MQRESCSISDSRETSGSFSRDASNSVFPKTGAVSLREQKRGQSGVPEDQTGKHGSN